MGVATVTGSGPEPAHVLRPERELLGWLAIMAVTIGLVAAAAADALDHHQYAALVVLLLVGHGLLALYAWISIDFVRWVT